MCVDGVNVCLMQLRCGAPNASRHPDLLRRHFHQALGLGEGGLAVYPGTRCIVPQSVCPMVLYALSRNQWNHCVLSTLKHNGAMHDLGMLVPPPGLELHPAVRGALALCDASDLQPQRHQYLRFSIVRSHGQSVGLGPTQPQLHPGRPRQGRQLHRLLHR